MIGHVHKTYLHGQCVVIKIKIILVYMYIYI